ncbi:MAG: hypothetical protein AB7E95_01730 [Kiritimatiellales bacterium]
MDSEQLLESFTYRFSASGVREPKRTSEELLAHVFGCSVREVHNRPTPNPLSSGTKMAMIRQLEALAERIESGESPQEVLNCVDF